VPGPARAAQVPTQIGHVHNGPARAGVYFRCFRHEDGGHAATLASGPVCLGRAGVLGKVLSRAKLNRVHVDADDHETAPQARGIDKAVVARVQSAHGGDEPNALARSPGLGHGLANLVNCPGDHHNTARILSISLARGR